MLYKTTQFEFKSGAKAGSFEGYAAVYGNVDDGYDVIAPDAFSKIRLKGNGRLRITIHHDTNKTVGDALVESDSNGLRLYDGQLNMKISEAADTHARMEDGSFDALSVGMMILPGGIEYLDSGARLITAAELWETTICAFGMNREALITSVKSVADASSDEGFIAQLITAGFTPADAKSIALHGIAEHAELKRSVLSGETQAAELSELKSLITKNPITF